MIIFLHVFGYTTLQYTLIISPIHQHQKEMIRSVPRETLYEASSYLKLRPGSFDPSSGGLSFKNIILISFSVIAAAFCSPVPVPSNGNVQGYRYELGATLRISCDTGYNLVPESSSFRACVPDNQGGGEWSGVDPVCERMFIVETLFINTSLSPCYLTSKYALIYSSADIISEKRTVFLELCSRKSVLF